MQVVKAWQATPTTSGEVSVTGLSPGTHYFVCSLGNHCRRGMRVNVTVTTEDQQDDGSSTTGTVCNAITSSFQIKLMRFTNNNAVEPLNMGPTICVL